MTTTAPESVTSFSSLNGRLRARLVAHGLVTRSRSSRGFQIQEDGRAIPGHDEDFVARVTMDTQTVGSITLDWVMRRLAKEGWRTEPLTSRSWLVRCAITPGAELPRKRGDEPPPNLKKVLESFHGIGVRPMLRQRENNAGWVVSLTVDDAIRLAKMIDSLDG